MLRPLLISYDMSFSGAPIALLALAEALKRLHENPVVMTMYDGPLAQRFRDAGIEFAAGVDPASVSFVIANTALSVPKALSFKRYGIPVAAWLHESAYSFETLAITVKLTPQQCGLHDLDLALIPGAFQRDELAHLLPAGRTYQMRNMVRQQWFRPDGGDSTLAVCGSWELRKGQARLIDLARETRRDCRFKFVGATWPPVAILDEATASRHRFLGAIEPDVAKLEIAKSAALVSCAQAEVQPLSLIEALMAGRPALVSNIAAHRALARASPNVLLFEHKSARSFDEGMRRLDAAIADVDTARAAREACMRHYGEHAFDRRLQEILALLRNPAAARAVPSLQDA